MLRTGASRLVLRANPIVRPSASFRFTAPAPAPGTATASPKQWTTQFSSVASKRPQTAALAQFKPIQAAVMRRALSQERREEEAKYLREKIQPTPETVSTTSSVHPILGEVKENPSATLEHKIEVSKGLKGDLETIRETFDLSEVPRQAYYIGLAGVLPYLATSMSTVACAYELNHSVAGYGYLMSAQTATTMLHFLEPLQIGYGAVILSFLGAIHWGLEFAGYGGHHGYRRYAIGVVMPAIAWPTVLMPVEYALITQFLAFTMLYYVDTRATRLAWTPPWYAIYRFVLTFIVGASIVVSLIGRGEVADSAKHQIPNPVDRAQELRENPQDRLAQEEAAIMAQSEAESAEAGEQGAK